MMLTKIISTCPSFYGFYSDTVKSPPLESEASEVALCHSCSRSAQPCVRRAVTGCAPQMVQLIWRRFRATQVDLLPLQKPLTASCLFPDWENTRQGCSGTQLTPGPAKICIPPSEPPCTDSVQSQGGLGAGPVGGVLLAQMDLVPRTDAPCDSPSLAVSSEEGSTFSEMGTRVQTSGNSMSGP